MEQTINDLPLTKVLIHPGYGSYGCFTDEFREEFKKTYNIDYGSIPYYEPDFDKLNKNKNIESRYDDRIVSLYEKLGNEKSIKQSNYKIDRLLVVSIPTEIIDTLNISDYDGSEWIWCNTSKKYKELLLLLNENKIDLPTLNNKTELIKKCEQYLIYNDIHFV